MNSIRLVHMNVAELVIAEEPLVISTVLGSCVSVCLYCPEKKMGGMNHFALPSEQYARVRGDLTGGYSLDAMNFGSTSLPILIEELCRRAKKSYAGVQAKIVGGASVVKELKQSSEIGALNVAIAEKILKKYGIPIVGTDVGGTVGRKVRFHTETGRLRVAPVTVKTETVDSGQQKVGRRRRVLIVDDSRTIRNLLTRIFDSDPSLEVVGTAADAIEAEAMMHKVRPDVMTLDIHMPGMDGVTFLEKILAKKSLPVVMITSLNIEQSVSVIRALELGAVDYVQKPTFAEMASMGPMVCEKVRLAANARIRISRRPGQARTVVSSGQVDKSLVVAMGASTGGTEALKDVLVRLPDDIPPIVVVQHIPAVFSATFADRLNELCPFEVKEAENGDLLKPGRVLIAPGGRQMRVSRKSSGLQVEVTDSPPVNRHKPSVDCLFESVAASVGKKAVGIILTGMGDDGALGLLKMRKAGAYTLAQDEASCVVFGMPKEAIRLGAAEVISHLDDIPMHLTNRMRKFTDVKAPRGIERCPGPPEIPGKRSPGSKIPP